MRSLELSLDKYDSDKIRDLNYLKEYDPIFEPYVQKKGQRPSEKWVGLIK